MVYVVKPGYHSCCLVSCSSSKIHLNGFANSADTGMSIITFELQFFFIKKTSGDDVILQKTRVDAL